MRPWKGTIKSKISAALCAISVLFHAVLLEGQAPSGQIRLEIQDPSGAPAQASGRLVHPGEPDRNFQTDAQGRYTFSDLPAGSYRVEVSKSGFATQAVSIDLQAATVANRTVTLALAPQTSRIDVV